MQITEIDGFNTHCVAKGVERDVSLFLLQDETIKEGDYLLIHVGYAIQKISEEIVLISCKHSLPLHQKMGVGECQVTNSVYPS